MKVETPVMLGASRRPTVMTTIRPTTLVDFVGLEGTSLPRLITEHPRISVHRIPPAISRFRHASGIVYSGFATGDALQLGWRLWRALRALPKPDLILVQNPPAFPTLEIARLALRRRGVRFIIDWHNLGYSLLQRRLGRWHPAVRLARDAERLSGVFAQLGNDQVAVQTCPPQARHSARLNSTG